MKNKNPMKENLIVRKMFFVLLSLSLILGACRKGSDAPLPEEPDGTENPVNEPFDAKLRENRTYRVGERVPFDLKGNPETIEFYSGLSGFEYALKNGKPGPSGMDLQFSIGFAQSIGSWPPTKPEWGPIPWDKISLLVSTDFSGDYSYEEVKKANWTNVTDRVKVHNAQQVYLPAGPVDLSDLTVIGKPFYFAYRMIDDHLKRPSYTIVTPVWSSILNGERQLIGQIKAGNPGENTINLIQIDEDQNNLADVTYVNNDRFTIRRKNNTASFGKELWLVSKGFNDVKETLHSFSSSVQIKSFGNSPLKTWTQVYTAPGTYEVGFEATALGSNGERRLELKMVTVVIVP